MASSGPELHKLGEIAVRCRQKMASSRPELHKLGEIMKKSTRIEEGTPTRFHLNSETNSHVESETFKKITFGEKDKNKPHKTILLVGETGTGKTKLINTMINYMLDVQREDKVWFEITDDQSDRNQAHSQTSIITVYGFYLPESKTDLTIIDTPGYGNRKEKNEKMIAMSLLKLSRLNGLISEIDAVCLVIKSTQNRLSDKQIYIFDAVQSLFGRDIAENIVLLFTHSRGAIPKNGLTAVKEAKIKCAVNDKNQPVFFLFDNYQGETFEEECQNIQEHSWTLSFKGMEGFFKFLDNIKSKALQLTQGVLQKRENLEEKISEIKELMLKYNKNFEVEVLYKEKVRIDTSLASMVLSCTVCKETCDSECWSFTPLSWCSMMKNNHCTVCTNKCHYSKHVKEAKIYVTKTKRENWTYEELKKEYDGKVKDSKGNRMSSVMTRVEEINELEKEKIKLVFEAFHCVNTLEMISLETDSLLTLQHIDFLIEKLKEINEPEKVKTLEGIKKRAGEDKHNALEYMKKYYK